MVCFLRFLLCLFVRCSLCLLFVLFVFLLLVVDDALTVLVICFMLFDVYYFGL